MVEGLLSPSDPPITKDLMSSLDREGQTGSLLKGQAVGLSIIEPVDLLMSQFVFRLLLLVAAELRRTNYYNKS